MEKQENEIGSRDMRLLERLLLLRIMDSLWAQHLMVMENIRETEANLSLSQMNPLDTYKRRGYELFQLLLSSIRQDVAKTIFKINSSTLRTLQITSSNNAASFLSISWARPIKLQILRL